jgi:hypothetical protein
LVRTHYCLEILAFIFAFPNNLFLTPELNTRSS